MEAKSAVWERAVFEMSPQSEKLSSELVMASYVDVGHLQRLRNGTSQLVEGRRGTGKTHLLTYLCQSAQAEGTPAIFIDARALRLESAPDASSPKHLTRGLYRELVEQVARQLEQFARRQLWQNPVPTARSPFEQQAAAQTEACLLRLRELASIGVPVRAPPRGTDKTSSTDVREAAGRLGAELARVTAEGHLGASSTRTVESSREVAVDYRLSFSDIGRQVEEFLRINDLQRCYLCIDEWSSLPLAAQPHFAEHLKRTFFPSAAVALKIGTLPFQTRLTANDAGQPIGFERNGDVFPGIDLDDDLVFFRKEERSLAIFSRLLHNHLSYALRDAAPDELPVLPEQTIDALFTEKAFPRLLAYAQGNPRDFLTLFRKAYLSFKESPVPQVTAPHVDAAAKEFGLEKIDSIEENPRAFAVFNRVVSEVLHTWKSNGFLVETELGRDETLLFLVHNRVLHVWDRSYSSPSHAGQRFLVLSIDFCILSEHLRSPSYRHIWEEVEKPLAESALARRERHRLERLAALEPPDKRVARYNVLPASFFEGPEAVTCSACGARSPPKHPVVVKLSACPQCGEKL